MVAILEGPKIAALSCGKPAYLVVLLHGEGSDGQSVIDQALNWAPTMPKADFVALEAPFANPGGGRRWFETDTFDPAAINEGLRTTAPVLDALLSEMLAARRLPDSHLALVGFSQGAILALHVGVTRAQPMAAVVAFSGALFDVGSETEVRSKPPMLMIHGDADAVIPFDAMRATKDRLKAAGVSVKSMRRAGLGHQMDDDGVIAAGDFLSALVVHKPAAAAAHEHDHDHDHDHDHAHEDHEHH